jgi:uncharacterized damage-inducible protein DinB
MVEVRALLEYNAKIRRCYFDTLVKLPWEEFVKNREASWHSMRNIFIHTLGATDHWLEFLQNEKRSLRREFDDYKSIQDVQTYMDRVEQRMGDYLNTLAPERMNAKYVVTNDAGEKIEINTEDVLIHVFEEEVHHRGELIALLWQINVEPPLMGWKYL